MLHLELPILYLNCQFYILELPILYLELILKNGTA